MQSTAPEKRMSQPIALVALFNEHNEILLLKRPTDVHCGGLWSLPGGKFEPGESPLKAAQRELAEEVGVLGLDWRRLGEYDYFYPDRQLHFHLFCCRGGNLPRSRRSESHVWTPIDRLNHYPMPEANSTLLNLLITSYEDIRASMEGTQTNSKS